MPIYREKRKVKVRCPKCNTEFTYTTGGYGDVPTSSLEQMINFARDIKRSEEGIKCPK